MPSLIPPTVSAGPFNEASLAFRPLFANAIQTDRAYSMKFQRPLEKLSSSALFMKTGLLRAVGKGSFGSNLSYILEREPFSPTYDFGPVVAPAPGATITLTITSGYNAAGTESQALAGTNVFINGVYRGAVTAVSRAVNNAHTITVRSFGAPWPAFPNGGKITNYSGAVAESANPASSKANFSVSAFARSWQKIHETYTLTDFSLMEAQGHIVHRVLPMPFIGEGVETTSWHHASMDEWWEQFQVRFMMTLLLGMQDSNTVRAAGGASQLQGLLDFIMSGGNVFNTPVGPMDIPWLESISDGLSLSRGAGTTENLDGLAGKIVMRKFQAMLDTKTQQGNNQQSQGTFDYTWNAVKQVGEMNFRLANCNEFNDHSFLLPHGFDTAVLWMPDTDMMSTSLSDGSTAPLLSFEYFENMSVPIEGMTPVGTPYHMTTNRGHSFVPNLGSPTLATDDFEMDFSVWLRSNMRNPEAFAIAI